MLYLNVIYLNVNSDPLMFCFNVASDPPMFYLNVISLAVTVTHSSAEYRALPG